MNTPMYKLSLYAMRAAGQQSAAAIVGSPASYGVSVPIATAYQAAFDAFDSAILDAEAAKVAYHAAVEAQSAARAAFLDKASQIGAIVYNNPLVTDSMLIAANFPPHDTTKSPQAPVTPTDFIVEAVANGTVNLKWNRNGGPANTNYIIETQTPGNETWTATYQTTKTKATLAGFTPGQPANFRIVAQKGDQFAYPTTTEMIYAPAPSALAFSEAA